MTDRKPDNRPATTGGFIDRGPATRTERRRLTHVDRSGRPRMVDVGEKAHTARRAVAEGFVTASPETLSLVIDGKGAKGDVLTVAEIAGVMGGKKTSELIPLCHPLSLTHARVEIEPSTGEAGASEADTPAAVAPASATSAGFAITATVETDGKTGVEMEALTAAAVAGLTLYDMCKAVDRGMVLGDVKLLSKEGGRSGLWTRDDYDGSSQQARKED